MLDGYLRSQAELDDRAVHLLFSANRWELACVRHGGSRAPLADAHLCRSRIESLLAAGTLVLCDRYAFSGVAFTAAKPGAPDVAWCAAPDAGLPAPDATLFLDVSPEVQRARGGFGEERYERAGRQAAVRAAFAALADGWATVDAGQAADAVEAAIWAIVQPLANGVDGPLGRLWGGRTFADATHRREPGAA
jgi:dTMP kinase